MTKDTMKKNKSLNQKIQDLDALLQQLESPDISIDDALPLYQSALQKSKKILTKFNQTTQKLEDIKEEFQQLSIEERPKE